jgi:uncharacterized protein (TIGR03000 family)
MSRTSWKCVVIGAFVVIALAVVASQANAQCCGSYRPVAWSGYAPRCLPAYYSSCYSPCYATVGCCGSYYASDWYLGVRPGPIRRLVFGPYRWYGVGWGCGYGWSYGCGYDYSPCCGDTPTMGTVPAPSMSPAQTPTPAKKPVVEPPAEPPTAPAPVEPGPGAVPPPVKTSSMSYENSGVLTVWVPYEAMVTVNGRETKSTGSRRQFVSFGLKPGLSYKYVVKAEIVRNGQTVEDTRTINLTAGQITAVAFGFNVTSAEQLAASH